MLIRRAQASELIRISEDAEPTMPAALQLIRAGLITPEGDLTEPGRIVVEAVKHAITFLGEPREWPEDRWVGTDVLQMIKVSERSGHVIDAWRGPLETRGFLRGGELTEAAGASSTLTPLRGLRSTSRCGRPRPSRRCRPAQLT